MVYSGLIYPAMCILTRSLVLVAGSHLFLNVPGMVKWPWKWPHERCEARLGGCQRCRLIESNINFTIVTALSITENITT